MSLTSITERLTDRLSLGGRASDRLARVARAVVPPVVVLVMLMVLIPLGLGSTIGAGAALGLVLVLLLLATVGLESSAVVLLGAGFLFAPMNDVKPVAAVSFVTVSDVFFFMGVVTLFPLLMTRTFVRQAPFLMGVGGIVAFGLISSALAPAPAASLNVLVRLIVGALMLPLVFMLWRPGRGVMTWFAAAYVAGNGISVLQGLATGVVSVEGRYIGLTEHPNILGLISMLAVALVPFLYAEVPSRLRWLVLVGGAVSAYGVWMSGSRAALAGTVVLALVYLMLSRSIEHGLVLFGLSIVPLYLVGRTFSSDTADSSPLGRLRGGGSATLSDIDRDNLHAVAIDKFLHHPVLGNGFADASLAHNIYLQVAAAGGVVGVLFFLVIVVSTIRQPLLLLGHLRLLALPAMGYAMVGPLTPLIWDRYIWCVLALPFLVPRPPGRTATDDVVHEAAEPSAAAHRQERVDG